MPKEQSESPFKDMYIPKNIQHNAGVVNFMYVRLSCKGFMSMTCQTLFENRKTCRGVFGALVAGLIAGIWGVTGWGGFLYYLAMQAVVSLHATAQHACMLCRYSSALPGAQKFLVYIFSMLTSTSCCYSEYCAALEAADACAGGCATVCKDRWSGG